MILIIEVIIEDGTVNDTVIRKELAVSKPE